jgi:hypothetical protein
VKWALYTINRDDKEKKGTELGNCRNLRLQTYILNDIKITVRTRAETDRQQVAVRSAGVNGTRRWKMGRQRGLEGRWTEREEQGLGKGLCE